VKKPEETSRQVRDRATHTMLKLWPDARAMARTEEEVATFERLTEAFQALLLADNVLEHPPGAPGAGGE